MTDKQHADILPGDIVEVRIPEKRLGLRGSTSVIRQAYSHYWDGHYWRQATVKAVIARAAVIEGPVSWGRKTHRAGIPLIFLRKVEPKKQP